MTEGEHRAKTSRIAWLTWTNCRRPIAFLLMPLAIALIAIAGLWGSAQRWVLALGAVVWLAIALQTRLPPEARGTWRYVLRNRRKPAALLIILALATVAAVLLAVAESASNESSWAAAFFTVALVAYAAGMTLFEWGTYELTRAPVLEWVVGPSALVWPSAVFVVARFVLHRPFIVWVLLVALVPPVALWIVAHLRARPQSRGGHGVLRLVQTVLLVLSGLAMLVAGLRIPVERHLTSTSELSTFPRLKAQPMSEDEAIATYSPVLRLTPYETWRETSVTRFKQESKLVGHAGCPKSSLECSVHTIPGDADGRALSGPVGTTGIFRQGMVYPHVATLTTDQRNALPSALTATRAIVEYWLFYPFDSWNAPTALGGVVQNHPADWEFVSVGFNDQWEPVFVAYSEHCKGVWRLWPETPVVSVDAQRDIDLSPAGNPTHPFVIVAKGSHANYPTTGSREPDWAGCLFPDTAEASHVLGVIGYAANARESTPDTGPIEVPSVVPLKRSERILALRWYWGNFSDTTLGGLGVKTSTVGIASPRLQPSGKTPSSVIGGWPHDQIDKKQAPPSLAGRP